MQFTSVNKHRHSALIAVKWGKYYHSETVVKVTYVDDPTSVPGIRCHIKVPFISLQSSSGRFPMYYPVPGPTKMLAVTFLFKWRNRLTVSRRSSGLLQEAPVPRKSLLCRVTSACGASWCGSTSLVLRPSFWLDDRNAKDSIKVIRKCITDTRKMSTVNKIKTLPRRPISNQ